MILEQHEWATIMVALHNYAKKCGEETKHATTIDERTYARLELGRTVNLLNKLRKPSGKGHISIRPSE